MSFTLELLFLFTFELLRKTYSLSINFPNVILHSLLLIILFLLPFFLVLLNLFLVTIYPIFDIDNPFQFVIYFHSFFFPLFVINLSLFFNNFPVHVLLELNQVYDMETLNHHWIESDCMKCYYLSIYYFKYSPIQYLTF